MVWRGGGGSSWAPVHSNKYFSSEVNTLIEKHPETPRPESQLNVRNNNNIICCLLVLGLYVDATRT